MEKLSQPLTLKCGLTLPNRLVKAAMAENMADADGLPEKKFQIAYGKWAHGGWGMVLTGESFDQTCVFVQTTHSKLLTRECPSRCCLLGQFWGDSSRPLSRDSVKTRMERMGVGLQSPRNTNSHAAEPCGGMHKNLLCRL